MAGPGWVGGVVAGPGWVGGVVTGPDWVGGVVARPDWQMGDRRRWPQLPVAAVARFLAEQMGELPVAAVARSSRQSVRRATVG